MPRNQAASDEFSKRGAASRRHRSHMAEQSRQSRCCRARHFGGARSRPARACPRAAGAARPAAWPGDARRCRSRARPPRHLRLLPGLGARRTVPSPGSSDTPDAGAPARARSDHRSRRSRLRRQFPGERSPELDARGRPLRTGAPIVPRQPPAGDGPSRHRGPQRRSCGDVWRRKAGGYCAMLARCDWPCHL
jgi:hypothetical protein